MQSSTNLLGLHILLTLQTNSSEKLTDYEGFNLFSNVLLKKYTLDKVGNSFHIFENNSFTAAICLSESHICIHTWPEINTLTADIYLCNYSADNTIKVKEIANEFIDFFEAKTVTKHEIYR